MNMSKVFGGRCSKFGRKGYWFRIIELHHIARDVAPGSPIMNFLKAMKLLRINLST